MRAIATVLSALTLGVGAAASESSSPLLRVVDRDPLVLEGWRFAPRERVVVTVTTGDARQVRVVRATRTGAFVARYTLAGVGACGFAASAIGSRGSRSTLKLPQHMCPPPLAP